MRKMFLLLLLFTLGSCESDDSDRTICPCTVTKVEKVSEGYKITVKGRSISAGENYSSEFTFITTQSHIIGDEIK